jgi:protein phosphatase methylesterase 1
LTALLNKSSSTNGSISNIEHILSQTLLIMSELQRSFARAQLARLPPEAPLIFDEREEDEAEDVNKNENDEDSSEKHARSASDSSASSTGTVVPSPTKHLFEKPNR